MLKKSLISSFITLIVSLISFINQVVIAKFFGASGEIEMYIAITSIPTLISGLISSGFNYAALPAFVTQYNKDKNSLLPFLFSVLRLTFIITFILYILLFLFINYFDDSLYYSLSVKHYQSYNLVLLFSWLSSFASIIISISNCYYNAKGQFRLPLLLSLIPIILSILLTFIFHHTLGVASIALGMFIGNATVLLLILMISDYSSFDNRYKRYKQEAVSVLKAVPIAAISMLCFSIYQTVDSIWGPLLGKSNLAYLSYAQRITIALGGLIIAGPFTILVPKLTESYDAKRMTDFYSYIISILKTVIIYSIIILVLVSIFSEDIIKLLFERGKFNGGDTKILASILPFYLIGMGFMLCSAILFRVLFITNKQMSALIISILMVFLYTFFSAILSSFLFIKGIGISYILSWIFTCIASAQIIFKNKISVIVKHNFIKDLFYALAIAVLLNTFIIMINKQFSYVDLWIKYIYITLISSLSFLIYNYSLFKLRVAEIRHIFNFFFLKKNPNDTN